MTINLQVGGVYATADGQEHGPMTFDPRNVRHMFSHNALTWTAYGRYGLDGRLHQNDLIRVISEPDAPTEAPAPDGVTVTTKVTQIEICAPETETMPAVTYSLVINDEGVLHITDGCGYGVTMSRAAARAIGAELIRMGGE
jgi:hypothetical protein